jgi:hypothetical protein
MDRAAVIPTAVLSWVVTTPGIIFSASRQIASSPVTSPTGTPQLAARSAFRPELCQGFAVEFQVREGTAREAVREHAHLFLRAGVVPDEQRQVNRVIEPVHHRQRLRRADEVLHPRVQVLADEIVHGPVAVVDEYARRAGVEGSGSDCVGLAGHQLASHRVVRAPG